jgi:AcrR family transcriptional regulator
VTVTTRIEEMTRGTGPGLPGGSIELRPLPDRPRGRSARAVANDEALRDAALALVAEGGWENLALQGVASRAGLTVGAIYARAENKSELGIDLWRSRCLPALSSELAALAAAIGGPTEPYRDALRRWFTPAPDLAGSLELALSARFDADLGEIVLDDLRTLAVRVRPTLGSPLNDRTLARLHLAFGAAFLTLSGERLEVPAGPPLEKALTGPQTVVAPILVADVPDDEEALAILAAAREVLVRVGHRRATAARIARTAGITTSALFGRFPTKALLFAAAVGGRPIEGDLAIELERLGRTETAIADWAAGNTPAARLHVLGQGIAVVLGLHR